MKKAEYNREIKIVLKGKSQDNNQCLRNSVIGTNYRVTRACNDRPVDNGFKLKVGRFRSHLRKKFFAVHRVRHWTLLPREAVDAPQEVRLLAPAPSSMARIACAPTIAQPEGS